MCFRYVTHLLITTCLQGPYDTMLHGCGGLKEGISNIMVLEINNVTSFAFSQKIPEAVSSYSGRALSVQSSSGTILGCGRIETLSSVDASYRSKSTLSQYSRYLPAILHDASNLDIRQYNILESTAGTCSSRVGIFDPWSPPGLQAGTMSTSDQFPVGDLPNHDLVVFSFLFEVPIIGSATVLGHVVSN